MNKKRLLKLAAFLRTVPRRAFDIDAWVRREASKPEGEVPGECGFAGCAMGWAAHAKLFRGLSTAFDHSIGSRNVYYKVDDHVHSGFFAGAHLFEISLTESENLFAPRAYEQYKPTPKQVAKRIEKFVKSVGNDYL